MLRRLDGGNVHWVTVSQGWGRHWLLEEGLPEAEPPQNVPVATEQCGHHHVFPPPHSDDLAHMHIYKSHFIIRVWPVTADTVPLIIIHWSFTFIIISLVCSVCSPAMESVNYLHHRAVDCGPSAVDCWPSVFPNPNFQRRISCLLAKGSWQGKEEDARAHCNLKVSLGLRVVVPGPVHAHGKVQVQTITWSLQLDQTRSWCFLFMKQTKWNQSVCPIQAWCWSQLSPAGFPGGGPPMRKVSLPAQGLQILWIRAWVQTWEI